MMEQDKSDDLINEEDREYIEFTREKAYYDRMSWKNYLKRVEQEAYEKAKKETYEKIQQEILSIVKGLLSSGMSEELVSNMKQLNLEQVRKIKAELTQ